MRARSFSSVEQIGQTDVVVELAFAVLLACFEWQEGVLRAESPAESAMWRSGRAGSEKSSWWVLTKSLARSSHRDSEYNFCPCQHTGNERLCMAPDLIFLHLGVWSVGKEPRSSVHLFKICTSMLGQVFLRMLPGFHKLPIPAKFNVLLQPKLKLEAILQSSYYQHLVLS